jgi:hypothetical protein
MDANWKRPKTLEGATISVPTPAGTLHLTFNYDKNTLVEVMGKIGRCGSYAATQLSILCILLSIVLQSPLSRKKIVKKIRKGLVDIKGELPFEHEGEKFEGYEDYIFKRVCQEIETAELQKEID